MARLLSKGNGLAGDAADVVTGEQCSGRAARVAMVGVGLIGGSLARALKSSGFASEVVGCALHAQELDRARELGVIDRGERDLRVAAADADVVVVATDLGAMAGVFAVLAECLPADAVVTDVGSVKGAVLADARTALGSRFPCFVPGHPIAGTEKSGVEACFDGLFAEHLVLLTPAPETDPVAVDRITRMWQAAGARVECIDAETHDDALALTSHVPHLIAYAMVEGLRRAAAAQGEDQALLRFAAGGFADSTRIAQSRPDLWVDIVTRNRRAVIGHGRTFARVFGELIDALEADDRDRLETVFRDANATRKALKDPRRA